MKSQRIVEELFEAFYERQQASAHAGPVIASGFSLGRTLGRNHMYLHRQYDGYDGD